MKTADNRFTPIILLIVFIFFGFAVFLCHYALQNERFYKPLSKFVKSYSVYYGNDGEKHISLETKPFSKIIPEKLIVWDAAHYKAICDNIYKNDKNNKANYAFFPLFPLIWRATGLNGLGICFFNWILFCFGMLFLYYLFKDKISKWMFLLILTLPMTVVYMIPYTESLFFICTAMGLYGIIKNNYPLYFVGFLLASVTRSSASIFIVAFICLAIVTYLRSKNIKQTLIDMVKRLLPIVMGVVLVIVFQRIYGAPKWFYFVQAQEIWGKYLSLPELPFRDWSDEGRSLTTPFLLLYFLPCVIIIIREFVYSFTKKSQTELSSWEYVKYLSMLYLAGNVFVALLTQHGSLNSLSRYLLCTPFFVFLLLDTAKSDRNKIWQLLYLVIGLVVTALCRSYFIKPTTIGIYLVMAVSFLTFFHRHLPKTLLYVLIACCILINIVWTSYLYDCFLSNAWIYT